ncbi:MAG: hypothetical protein GY934_04450 [Gammaproteobacteria bacterium]|nr:hypothetical protein [Gammaproteobacteria bacterium]
MPGFNKKIRQLLQIVVLLGLSHATVQAAEAKWYSVEIVIFSQDSSAGGRTGQWPIIESLPDWSDAVTIQPGVSIPPAVQTDMTVQERQTLWSKSEKTSRSASFSMLSPSNLRLNAIITSLRGSNGRFTPLLHLAWRQPAQSKKSAKTIYLQSPETSTNGIPRLQGTVRLSVQRYLHIDLDLLLQRKEIKRADDSRFMQSNSFSPERTGYRFKTHRRMRSEELHYLDHPRLGAIVIVRPS